MPRRALQWVVLVTTLLLTGPLMGCSLFGGLFGATSAASPDAQDRRYAGSACDEVLYSLEESDYNAKPATYTTDPRIEVLLGICHRSERTNTTNHRIVRNPRFHARRYLTRHAHFDDRRNDSLEVALMLDHCAANDCRRVASYVVEPGPLVITAEDGEAGMLFSYAAQLDIDQLRAKLGALELEPAAVEMFIERVSGHQQRLNAAVEAMSEPKRALVADIPVEVRRERAQYFETHAELYAALDGIVEVVRRSRNGGSTAGPGIAELRALRSRYAAQCESPECRFDPFYVETTRELVTVHLAAQSALDVVVESRLLAQDKSLEVNMAEAILRAQSKQVYAATEARNTKRKATSKGLDAGSVAALVGDVTPLDVDIYALWRPDIAAVRYDELIDTKSLAHVQSYVRKVKVTGDRAEVTFKGSSYQSREAYGCRRTGRISRIDADGRVHYESDCKYKSVTRQVPPVDPIILPASEANALRSGELVDAYVTGPKREGRVLKVNAGEPLQLVQWLNDRFGG